MATKATIHNTSDGSSVIAFGDGSFTVASSPEELRSLIPEGIYTYVEKNSSKNAMDLITEHQNLHADIGGNFGEQFQKKTDYVPLKPEEISQIKP